MSTTSLPQTIEQITIPHVGGVEVVEKTTQPFPTVGENDIVIKVEYGGVNFIDTYFRSGLYPLPRLPHGLGKEASGTIVQLPASHSTLQSNESYAVRNYHVGQKVVFDQLGCFATYASVPWKTVWPLPEKMDTKMAAASALQALTTTTFFEEAYKVKAGDKVFIHTVAGGLGLLMVQLAKHIGASVIGTTSTPEKAKLAKDHGADEVILYKEEDVVKRTLEWTKGEGVDVVFDGVGKDTFDMDFELLKRKGTLVTLGNASGAVPPSPPAKLTAKNLKLLRPTSGNYLFTPEECNYYTEKTFKLIADGVLKINIHKEYPFTTEGVQEAQRDLTQGRSTGKLLIKIA